jgi:hypothetical protein
MLTPYTRTTYVIQTRLCYMFPQKMFPQRCVQFGKFCATVNKELRAVLQILRNCQQITTSSYLAENDLWGQVFRCTAQRPSSALHSLGKPEVCHLLTFMHR